MQTHHRRLVLALVALLAGLAGRLAIPSTVPNVSAASTVVPGSLSQAPVPATTIITWHAGSLNGTMSQLIGPGFTSATGYLDDDHGAGSVTIAQQMHSGAIHPDVFMSADAEVNQVLMGPSNGDTVRWYLIMARNKIVLAYSPQSRFKADLDAAAAGAKPWYEVLQEPGFHLERGDPATDPLAYRTLFLLQLAERYYNVPGLASQILGDDENAAQVAADSAGDLQKGIADATTSYLSSALESGTPYITLPDEVDLSNPALSSIYATASYTAPDGTVFHGTPTVYSVTIPTNAQNEAGAEAFVRYLLSDTGRSDLTQHGFSTADVLVGGDASAVPAGLQNLIQGTYAP